MEQQKITESNNSTSPARRRVEAEEEVDRLDGERSRADGATRHAQFTQLLRPTARPPAVLVTCHPPGGRREIGQTARRRRRRRRRRGSARHDNGRECRSESAHSIPFHSIPFRSIPFRPIPTHVMTCRSGSASRRRMALAKPFWWLCIASLGGLIWSRCCEQPRTTEQCCGCASRARADRSIWSRC